MTTQADEVILAHDRLAHWEQLHNYNPQGKLVCFFSNNGMSLYRHRDHPGRTYKRDRGYWYILHIREV